MVPDHPIARAAAFAPVTPRSLNPGDQRPPLAGQVEGISNLGWRPHPRAQPADPWCDILELAHHHNRTGANRSPHPFRFIGEDSIRAASHTNPKAIGLVTHFSAETNTLYLQPISFRTLTRSYLAFLRGSARNAFARADPFLVEPPGNGGDRPAIAHAEAISAIGDAQRTAQLQPVHGLIARRQPRHGQRDQRPVLPPHISQPSARLLHPRIVFQRQRQRPWRSLDIGIVAKVVMPPHLGPIGLDGQPPALPVRHPPPQQHRLDKPLLHHLECPARPLPFALLFHLLYPYILIKG